MSDDIVERLRRRMAWRKDDCEDLRESADEIARLRADLAAVTAERDRMREALKPFAVGEKVIHGWYSCDIFPYVPDDHPVLSNKITVGDLRRAKEVYENTK